jgi:hypothetical protein
MLQEQSRAPFVRVALDLMEQIPLLVKEKHFVGHAGLFHQIDKGEGYT